ncbi:hypothetical protein BKA66DRAFT_37940 [Pyrenochaeta sp. MPI-SDFR-AT-0127]|nr:hypothetical protein BKA66DRAFT_37940 [Pyrenochaeta sp. MPI-SDFR-AT-0127]
MHASLSERPLLRPPWHRLPGPPYSSRSDTTGGIFSNTYDSRASRPPNPTRLRRLSRVDGPPHSDAPETSPRAATARPFTLGATTPGPVPTTGVFELTLRAPSDCIPDPPQCPGAPHPRRCRWSTPPPALSRPGQLPLKLSCRATSVAYSHHCLAACESEVPCPSCCICIGLDFRVPSLSWAPSACSTTITILAPFAGCSEQSTGWLIHM